jgi:hypothetical protein
MNLNSAYSSSRHWDIEKLFFVLQWASNNSFKPTNTSLTTKCNNVLAYGGVGKSLGFPLSLRKW